MKRAIVACVVVLALVAAHNGAGGAAEPDGLRVEVGVKMKTRDGVSLVADVYRPDAEGRFPTLLQRTPYDRKGGIGEARALAAAGYVVIRQDVRGRFDSEGEFYPFRAGVSSAIDALACLGHPARRCAPTT